MCFSDTVQFLAHRCLLLRTLYFFHVFFTCRHCQQDFHNSLFFFAIFLCFQRFHRLLRVYRLLFLVSYDGSPHRWTMKLWDHSRECTIDNLHLYAISAIFILANHKHSEFHTKLRLYVDYLLTYATNTNMRTHWITCGTGDMCCKCGQCKLQRIVPCVCSRVSVHTLYGLHEHCSVYTWQYHLTSGPLFVYYFAWIGKQQQLQMQKYEHFFRFFFSEKVRSFAQRNLHLSSKIINFPKKKNRIFLSGLEPLPHSTATSTTLIGMNNLSNTNDKQELSACSVRKKIFFFKYWRKSKILLEKCQF